jgi:hypothetical protein
MNKLLIAGVIVVALLILAGLLIKKSVRAEIVINASPQEVWSTITNASTYGEWNPIFVQYEGDFAAGNTLTLHMKIHQHLCKFQ